MDEQMKVMARWSVEEALTYLCSTADDEWTVQDARDLIAAAQDHMEEVCGIRRWDGARS